MKKRTFGNKTLYFVKKGVLKFYIRFSKKRENYGNFASDVHIYIVKVKKCSLRADFRILWWGKRWNNAFRDSYIWTDAARSCADSELQKKCQSTRVSCDDGYWQQKLLYKYARLLVLSICCFGAEAKTDVASGGVGDWR